MTDKDKIRSLKYDISAAERSLDIARRAYLVFRGWTCYDANPFEMGWTHPNFESRWVLEDAVDAQWSDDME